MRTVIAAVLLSPAGILVLAGAGCSGPATFVAASPPPDVTAEAWFASPPVAVHRAMTIAMTDVGMSVDDVGSSAMALAATKNQLPHVSEDSGGPAPGSLPFYRLEAALSRTGSDVHVRATVRGVCQGCDGSTPYVWQYPEDLLRAVFERTRSILGERHVRFAFPGRYRPPAWATPRHG